MKLSKSKDLFSVKKQYFNLIVTTPSRYGEYGFVQNIVTNYIQNQNETYERCSTHLDLISDTYKVHASAGCWNAEDYPTQSFELLAKSRVTLANHITFESSLIRNSTRAYAIRLRGLIKYDLPVGFTDLSLAADAEFKDDAIYVNTIIAGKYDRGLICISKLNFTLGPSKSTKSIASLYPLWSVLYSRRT